MHSGEAAFDLKAASKILRRLAAENGVERGGLEGLQQREPEVLKSAAKGMSNKEIANEPVISDLTVQLHTMYSNPDPRFRSATPDVSHN